MISEELNDRDKEAIAIIEEVADLERIEKNLLIRKTKLFVRILKFERLLKKNAQVQ